MHVYTISLEQRSHMYVQLNHGIQPRTVIVPQPLSHRQTALETLSYRLRKAQSWVSTCFGAPLFTRQCKQRRITYLSRECFLPLRNAPWKRSTIIVTLIIWCRNREDLCRIRDNDHSTHRVEWMAGSF